MGLNVQRTRTLLFLSTVLLAGTVTAFCGPVGFIGLAVPHLARMLFASADHRILMPGSMLAGAALLLVCDLISKTLALPINTVTGHLDTGFLGEMDEEQLDKLADDMGVDTTGKDKAEVVAAVAEEPVEVPDISKMKLDELKEFAEDNGIDLTGCTTKASILQKIREYEADAAAAAAIIAPEG